jgi:hypothetical protein
MADNRIDTRRLKSLTNAERKIFARAMSKRFPQCFTPEESKVVMKACLDGDTYFDMKNNKTYRRLDGQWVEAS